MFCLFLNSLSFFHFGFKYFYSGAMPRAHVALVLASLGSWNFSPVDRQLVYFLFRKLLERFILEVEIWNLQALFRHRVIYYSVLALPLLASTFGILISVIGWLLCILVVVLKFLAQVFLWGSHYLSQIVIAKVLAPGEFKSSEIGHLWGNPPLSK